MHHGCVSPIPGIGCGTLVNSGSGGTTNGDGLISPPYPTGWSIPDGDYAGHNYKLIVTFGANDEPYATFYTKVDTLLPDGYSNELFGYNIYRDCNYILL